MRQSVNVILMAHDREQLLAIVSDRCRPLKHVERARIILVSAERLPADVDAGLARLAQDLARARLVALADKQEVPTAMLPKPEPAKVPEDIRKLLDHRGHALLIGVSDYTNDWDKLPSVKDDLRKLEEGLKPSFETVEPVLSPTVDQIRFKIRNFLMRQWNKANERLLI